MKRTPLQLRHCANLIKNRLAGKTINEERNKEVVAGYKAAISIITKGIDRIVEYDLSDLHTPQARAIAFLAVDFVNGITSEKILLRIPLKKKPC